MIDDEYFIVCRPRQDDQRHDLLPSLSPDDDTVKLRYRFEVLPLGPKPLTFRNGAREFRERRGMTTMKSAPPIMFDGDNLIVDTAVRDRLLQLDLPDVVLQPVIYIDDQEASHENYWFMTFLSEFSDWDKGRSKVGEKIRVGDEEYHSIIRVSFHDARMQAVPLRQRLLFKLDTFPGLVIAHESIAAIFAQNGASGALVVSLADYPNRP